MEAGEAGAEEAKKGVEAAKENVGPAEATEEASALLRRGGEYEYEDDAKFGSSIVIKSHP